MVKEYLSNMFNLSHWPYYGVIELFNHLDNKMTKDEIKKEIKLLKAEGMIDIVHGINGWLIEIKNIKSWGVLDK